MNWYTFVFLPENLKLETNIVCIEIKEEKCVFYDIAVLQDILRGAGKISKTNENIKIVTKP